MNGNKDPETENQEEKEIKTETETQAAEETEKPQESVPDGNNTNDTDTVRRIRLKRHLWPEELALKKAEHKVKQLKVLTIILLIAGLGIGYLGGSVLPAGFMSGLRSRADAARGLSSTDKINTIKEVMDNDWYFSKDIDNIDERMSDQAITGMTTNKEDPHTEYMTSEEADDFRQSINRNYVGIGVTFIHSGDANIVTEIFPGSPAEKAGVKSGDIIYAVEETQTNGLSASEVKDLVSGKEGTEVSVTFQRDGRYLTYQMTRAKVSATVSGHLLDDQTAYVKLSNFGDDTPNALETELNTLTQGKNMNLVLDLRNDGGGYLNSLSQVAAFFLPEKTVVMKQEYKDGTVTEIRTGKGQMTNIGRMVVLVNENTASAAEVLTLALKEQRDNVTIVGTTTYGKGTVQVSRAFSDGSTLKYTTSRWLSPNGTWVNNTGITPDKEVELHAVLTRSMSGMEENQSFAEDQVDDRIGDAELCLDYLGYEPGRTDGYFSDQVEEALKKYQTDDDLSADGILNEETYTSLLGSVYLDWNSNTDHDTQLKAALEVLHG